MRDLPEGVGKAVESWLGSFKAAIANREPELLRSLFHAESHWRDLLALTWDIRTINGADAIVMELTSYAASVQPTDFALDPGPGAVRKVTRAGIETIESIFRFEVAHGRGRGVLRLTNDPRHPNAFKAWTLLTSLDALRAEQAELKHGHSNRLDFRGPNWLDHRRQAVSYADRDPAVLVVGGGQAGLSISARLGQCGVDTLIVDRGQRVGDNWRKRYHALTLHNQTHVNHLPYMPFPQTWPTYIPKDKLAGWFEAYVEAMELNYWAGMEVVDGTFNENEDRWSVTLRQTDGSVLQTRPKHVVMATGVSCTPDIPHIPTLERFAGVVLHSSQYDDGAAWSSKSAIVVGTGNSGHDIAQDLYSAGANVTLVQRSSTLVVNIEPSAQLPYAIYSEGLPLEDTDLIAASIPLAVAKRSHIRFTEHARKLDEALLTGLKRAGFKLDFGEDGTGWQFKYLTRGGGYYFNVGCSDLIAERKIRLVQFDDLTEFVDRGVRTRDGETLPADLIVLASGYKGQEHLVRKLFGRDVAARVGPIWGFGDGDELRNMFVRTGQPGLWFIGGSLAQCRIYSRYLALQIKACETGLLLPRLGERSHARGERERVP